MDRYVQGMERAQQAASAAGVILLPGGGATFVNSGNGSVHMTNSFNTTYNFNNEVPTREEKEQFLQVATVPGRPVLFTVAWLDALRDTAASVCALMHTSKKHVSGTGFLLGGGRVMTNAHVAVGDGYRGTVGVDNWRLFAEKHECVFGFDRKGVPTDCIPLTEVEMWFQVNGLDALMFKLPKSDVWTNLKPLSVLPENQVGRTEKGERCFVIGHPLITGSSHKVIRA